MKTESFEAAMFLTFLAIGTVAIYTLSRFFPV